MAITVTVSLTIIMTVDKNDCNSLAFHLSLHVKRNKKVQWKEQRFKKSLFINHKRPYPVSKDGWTSTPPPFAGTPVQLSLGDWTPLGPIYLDPSLGGWTPRQMASRDRVLKTPINPSLEFVVPGDEATIKPCSTSSCIASCSHNFIKRTDFCRACMLCALVGIRVVPASHQKRALEQYYR